MKLLAIETSTMLGGVAISDDAKGLIAEVRLNVKSTHSERLMMETDHILRQSGLTIDDMEAFAVAEGPGSFTGLRIGISTAKGFSFATGKPVVAVRTLEGLAMNFPFCRYPVCTLLDARKKEVYGALFRWEGTGFVRVLDERSSGLSEMMREVAAAEPGEVLFAGEGALVYRESIAEAAGTKARFAPSEKNIPSPANIAMLGMQKALAGRFADPRGLVPFYARRSEAEIKRDV
jgi:tRNA threonylcarbamoyladenosine biosynthesis protein TsaB